MAEEKDVYEQVDDFFGRNDPAYDPLKKKIETSICNNLQDVENYSFEVAKRAAKTFCRGLKLEALQRIESSGLSEEDSTKLMSLADQYKDERQMWDLKL